MELLAYLRFHGFLLFPGVPNTTAVTQETDQSYGPFQSKLRSNLEIIVDERLRGEVDGFGALECWAFCLW
jgi:hypothetical protein